jgi:hypothetical protein
MPAVLTSCNSAGKSALAIGRMIIMIVAQPT